MNSREQQLKRLLQSARHAAARDLPQLTWAGELSVLAEWRRARARGEAFDWLPLLHRAVAIGCVVALIVATASMTLNPAAPQADELSSLNEVVNAAAAWL
jgi:hypothetical protein